MHVSDMYILHMYFMCRNTGVINNVENTCVMQIFYTCNTHKTSQM